MSLCILKMVINFHLSDFKKIDFRCFTNYGLGNLQKVFHSKNCKCQDSWLLIEDLLNCFDDKAEVIFLSKKL